MGTFEMTDDKHRNKLMVKTIPTVIQIRLKKVAHYLSEEVEGPG